ncbi:hypothetical protein ACXR2T_08045 [Leucobacter sp. HY1910]
MTTTLSERLAQAELDGTADGALLREARAAIDAIPTERVWSEAELDALPDDSLVGVNASPEGWDEPRYEVFQKWGDKWSHLDPTDRDDGEYLAASGYLIHLSSRYGQTHARIRALYIPEVTEVGS